MKTFFALIDYAGVANRDIKDILGTQVEGVVIEQRPDSNTARITVDTLTTRALGFAQSIKDLKKKQI